MTTPRLPDLLPDEDTEAMREIENGFARWGLDDADTRDANDIDHDDDWNGSFL